MKKSLLILAGLALVASSALGQQVLSRNAVGYTRVEVRSNGFTLASIPFNAFSNTINGIFGGQLVGGSPSSSDQLLIWDKNAQSYITLYKNVAGEWRDANTLALATNTMNPGDGFWIRSRRTSNQVVYLMGEVPDRFTMPTGYVDGVVGFNMVGYGFPVSSSFTGLTLYATANKGGPSTADQALFWDVLTQTYITYYASVSGWRDANTLALASNVVNPADGFWFRRRGAVGFTWSETKPYTWP